MKQQEFLEKWKTGRERMSDLNYNLVFKFGKSKNITTKEMCNVNSAKMGDFIKDYIKHLNAPWWKRGFDWGIIEENMRTIMNEIEFEWLSVKEK